MLTRKLSTDLLVKLRGKLHRLEQLEFLVGKPTILVGRGAFEES